MNNLVKQWQYYVPGVFLTAISLVILLFWDVTLFNGLLGISIFGAGAYLFFLGYQKGQEKQERNLIENEGTTKASYQAIHTQGGTYNESVQGDYITVQGNQIYINQDFSQFAAQIQDVLFQLQTHGYSREVAEQQVTNDLKTHARSNARVKEKLLRWRKSLESPNEKPFNETEAAERVVKIASENSSSSVCDPILVIEGKYRRLYDLLRHGNWEEADVETAKIMIDLMPYRGYQYLAIDQIPPKDLKRLNQLWVKCSNGHFGFSVQKSIWKKVLEIHNYDEGYPEEDAYLAFIDCVGWAREGDCIYHTDFKYSLKAPRGHLPAVLMLDFSHYYNPSNYCRLDSTTFDGLMKREY